MKDLLISENIAHSASSGAAYIMESPGSRPAVAPTTGVIETPFSPGGATAKVAYWGESNDFPQIIMKMLEKDAEMKALIDFCVRASFGKGIVCLNEIDIDDNGNPVYKAVKDPAINAWYRSPQVRKYCQEGLIDLFTYYNVFPELIVSRDRKTIAHIQTNEAIHCRWQLMGNDGKLNTVIHNKNWPYAKLDDPNQTTFITAVDPYDFNVVDGVKTGSLNKFIYPLNYPTVGKTYYQVAHWDGLRASGWLEIAEKIPAFKKALLKNQMTIKYLVRIPNNYWASVYKEWDKYTEDQQKLKKQEKMDEINKSLCDVENAGKSILNEVGIDPITKEKIPGWEIVVIDDKTKPGAFLADSQEASAHKMRALGLDPTLVGTLITGSGMGAGSGSDKQLAWNIFLAMIDTYREIILDPLHFKAQYDGLYDTYPGFKLKFRDSIMETVNGHNQNKTEGLT